MNNKWLVLSIVCIGIFMSTLDSSILNIANPTIAAEFAVSIDTVQWVVTSYMVAITATLLLFGRLGDRVGGNKVYTAGFLLFAMGSWLCSISPSLEFLALSRVFQGIGASMLMATGIGIVSNTFPAGERGKALGLTGTVVGIGSMAGPSLGGVLVTSFGWPTIFLINVPIGVLGFMLGWKYLPAETCEDGRHPFDFTGLVLFLSAVISSVVLLSRLQQFSTWLLLIPLGLFAGFYLFEKQVEHPLLDLALLRIPRVACGNIQAACAYLSQTFPVFLLPFYFEKILHLLPSQSGLFMTVIPAAQAITAPLAGSLSDRIGSARLVSVAFVLMGSAHLALSTLSPNSSSWHIGTGLLLLGIGNGMFGSPNSSSIFAAIPRERASYMGGVIATVRNLSYAMGFASAASIFTCLFQTHASHHLPFADAFTRSLATTYRVAATVALLGFLTSLRPAEGASRLPQNPVSPSS